jgi:hypothetical protein
MYDKLPASRRLSRGDVQSTIDDDLDLVPIYETKVRSTICFGFSPSLMACRNSRMALIDEFERL